MKVLFLFHMDLISTYPWANEHSPPPRYSIFGLRDYRTGYNLSTLFNIQAATSFFSPLVSSAATGIGIGPPGELGNLAVKISQPSSVIKRVCSARHQ